MTNRCERKTLGRAIAGTAMGLCLMVALPAAAGTGVALDFDRDAGDHAVTQDAIDIQGNDPRTVEVWAYTRFDGADDERAFFISWGGEGNAFGLRIWDGEYSVWDWGGDGSWAAGISVDMFEWQHHALTYDGNEMIWHINGEEAAQDDDRALDNAAAELYIGAEFRDQRFMDGMLSDLRIWDHARSQSEIQEDMNRRLDGDEDGLVGYWPMDEGSGDTAHDLSPRGNHAAIVGAQWVEVEDHPVAPPIVEVRPPSIVSVAPEGSTELGPVQLHVDYEADATFQWYFEGEELEGETDEFLFIDDATEDQAGTYTVVVDHPDIEPLEFDIVLRVREVDVPAAGVAGLLAAGGLIALAGLARTRRRQ